MTRLSRPEIAVKFKESGLIPLYYNADAEIVKKVVMSCYKGGARFFEFTNRGEFAHEVFAQLVKYAREKCPEMILGVGSVTDAASASFYISLGAEFVVSPVIREDVAIVCNRQKVNYLPGCGSLNEICAAEELGCEIVKLFPGDVYGPQFVKAVRGPQPWTSIMPSGGVLPEKENLQNWFNAGVTCVGMGSALITGEIVKNSDYQALEQKVSQALELISQIRKE